MTATIIEKENRMVGVAMSIWHKQMRKFFRNTEELLGLMIQPVLWVVLFGVGMRSVMGSTGAGDGYVGFMLPGIVALSAMGGAIGGGMAWLDERIRGVLKEYLVAPIPRFSILIGNAAGTISKALIQAVVIFAIGVLMGAEVSKNYLGWVAGFLLLVGYGLGFTGLALMIASQTDNLMAYHAMIMLLNLPVLFLSNALYPLSQLPGWMRAGALVNPTTYLVDGMRQTVLAGAHTLPLWLCAAVTTAFAALGLIAAARAFKTKTRRG